LPEIRAVHPDCSTDPAIDAPASRSARVWTRSGALIELLRGRVAITGPTTARQLAASLSIDDADADAALLALESEGLVLRGVFETMNAELAGIAEKINAADSASASADPLQWCDRRLLARIHRYTLNRLRAEIEPVSPAGFMRFLFAWQHVAPSSRLTGADGLRAVMDTLDGFELAADAWERAVLPARIDGYEPSMLDMLCLTGEVGWARLSASTRDATQLVGATPVALFLREHGDAWQTLRSGGDAAPAEPDADLGNAARHVFEVLRGRGASFIAELAAMCELDEAGVRTALADLVAAGLVSSDGFGGLRSIIHASSGRFVLRGQTRVSDPGADPGSDPRRRAAGRASVTTGRWSILGGGAPRPTSRDAAVETQARALLRRYGIVFRRLLAREANVAPWRELSRVYRRLEARGEIRGGRFVTGMSGEQFATGNAVERMREIRRAPPDGRCIVISAADPLNLAGIVTAGDRVRAVAATRVVYRDGVPMAAMEGDYMRPLIPLVDVAPGLAAEIATTLAGRPVPVLSGFVGR